MATRVGINGFGRIGRQSLRALLERYPRELEVIAVNDDQNILTKVTKESILADR
jgi:glyceraldehyde-3-phosphate dehydrogenase/erythrose-4-phosphate dehydrogenase